MSGMIDLKDVITKYPESLESAMRFRAYMADLYPEKADQARIKVLADVISCGVVDEIKAGNTDSLSISRYRKLMEDRYGYSALLVSESIRKWVQAYASDADSTPKEQSKPMQQPQVVNNGKIHIHEFEDVVVEPTCRERGYTLHRCKCGYEHRNKFTPVGDHRFEMVDEIKPTCVEEGRRDYLCSVCSEYKSVSLPKVNHQFGAWQTAQKAGCGVEGRKERRCLTCAKTEDEIIPALQHKWSDWVDSIFPTCTEKGKQLRQCKHCNEIEERGVPAIGHKFSEWQPSATQVEMMERYCENCGEVQWESTKKVEQLRQIEMKEKPAKVVVGSVIEFGAYWQGPDRSAGKTPIEWLVLAKENGKVLVISKYALDCQQHNSSFVNMTWEKCSLRTWMNKTFLNNAFSTDEQSKIAATSVSADKNPEYRTNPGNETTDKVFLLSITEARKHFAADDSRKCVPTAYAKAQGAYTSDSHKTASGEATCWWWLRSPGTNQRRAAGVNDDGSVSYSGLSVDYAHDCIRPALWINLGDLTMPQTQPMENRNAQVSGKKAISKFSIGSVVEFGTYWQGKDKSAGKTPIEWQVLANEGNKALLISKCSLDCEPYNIEQTNVTWENCTLRQWLNNEFLRAAFSVEEQTQIQNAKVSADKNLKYNTDPGNATTDKVFLLSINEVNKYFSNDEARKCTLTAYTKVRGAYSDDSYKTASGEETCWWWLRSPSSYQSFAAYVSSTGSIGYYGPGVNSNRGTVRPAIWINMEIEA